MHNPAISIVMAARNEERYLPATLQSLLRQRGADFELICIDDASDDATIKILRDCADPRLVVLRNDTPQGVTVSLNRGLKQAIGRYIARADADDLYHPERLRRQMDFLERNADYAAVSCAATFIDEDGRRTGRESMPGDDLSVRWRALFNSPFMHPAVMLRKSVLDRHGLAYDERLPVAQDYELWSRLLAHGKGANLRRHLYIRRDRGNSISAKRLSEQHAVRDTVSRKMLERQFPGEIFDKKQVDRMRDLFVNRTGALPQPADIDAYTGLIRRFLMQNCRHADMRMFCR
ncbi:MAG TPA: glycosyltransferase, partial [Patescibacteria group bacterium]|nr:glycosyltransferase [Patescibacteria group bacterium]